MTSYAVSGRGIRVMRGQHEVLHDLTFGVAAGQITGLLGPSGGGKSTLLRAVVGVQDRVAGDLEVLGLPAGHPSLRPRIGYVTQSPAVYGDLSVRRNLEFFADVLDAAPARVDAVLRDVALVEFADRRVDRLSGGQRARVSLATALLGQAELLVLDEPTVGLDPVLRRDLWALFRRLAEQGRTILVSSHVMDEASRCDRLLLLRDGRLVADSTLHELLTETKAPDIEAAFLALAESVPEEVSA